MPKLYRIKDWEKHFENNRTRGMKTMSWFQCPIKLNGSGYVALMSHKNGPAYFGIWIALVQLASQSERRGEFSRGNGAPLDEKSIATLIRTKEKLLSEAISVLTSKEIGWLEVIESGSYKDESAGCLRLVPQEGAGKVPSRRGEERTGEERRHDDARARLAAAVAKELADSTDRKLSPKEPDASLVAAILDGLPGMTFAEIRASLVEHMRVKRIANRHWNPNGWGYFTGVFLPWVQAKIRGHPASPQAPESEVRP